MKLITNVLNDYNDNNNLPTRHLAPSLKTASGCFLYVWPSS